VTGHAPIVTGQLLSTVLGGGPPGGEAVVSENLVGGRAGGLPLARVSMDGRRAKGRHDRDPVDPICWLAARKPPSAQRG
jgi:hypothetical protein